MMDDLLIATDQMAGPSRLLITDRKTNNILSSTPVSTWGHGVTVNFERGEAFVWAKDGTHRISLAQKTMGKHLGVIPSLERGERCWFCWTPQGARFTHDVAWNWSEDRGGDYYQPYLTAVDIGIFNLQKNSFEGTVKAGPARPSFFERDMAFCKNRDFALVTNTAEKSISLLNLKRREEVRRIYLPRRPAWFKSLSV